MIDCAPRTFVLLVSALAALGLAALSSAPISSAATPVEEFTIEAKISPTKLGKRQALRIHSIRVSGAGVGKSNVTVRCRASRRNCKRLRRGRIKKVKRGDTVTWKNVNWVLTPRNGIGVKVGKRGKIGRFANVGPAAADPKKLVYKKVGCVDRAGKFIDCPGGNPVIPGQEVVAPTPVGNGGTPAPVRRVITVDNRVTNGMGMREDPTPLRMLTKPWILCGSRGCNINGTERVSGQTYDAAVCQTQGERTTNGHDTDPSDDANPLRFESTRYYGVRLGNGTFGYVTEVWIRAADRGGLGLPQC